MKNLKSISVGSMTFSSLVVIVVLVLLGGSCKKKATKIDKKFAGIWVHHEKPNRFHQIDIAPYFSKGSYIIYDSSNIKLDSLEKKVWVISDNNLFCGRSRPQNWHSSWRFTIDQYPDTSEVLIINQYDTVFPGDPYMILNGNYFVNHQ